MINADDRHRPVELGMVNPGARAHKGMELLEFTDAQAPVALDHTVPDPPEELQIEVIRSLTFEAGVKVDTFGLLHVEAHIVDVVLQIEIDQGIGMAQALAGEHRDHGERQIGVLKGSHAAHAVGMATGSPAGESGPVMQKGRPIQADPHLDAVAAQAVAPQVVDQGAVGLHRLIDMDTRVMAEHLIKDGGGVVVKGRWAGEGLPGMPEQGESFVHEGALQHPLQAEPHQIQVDQVSLMAVGEIAVGAVEVAEGGGLDHQQTHGPEGGGVHLDALPPATS